MPLVPPDDINNGQYGAMLCFIPEQTFTLTDTTRIAAILLMRRSSALPQLTQEALRTARLQYNLRGTRGLTAEPVQIALRVLTGIVGTGVDFDDYIVDEIGSETQNVATEDLAQSGSLAWLPGNGLFAFALELPPDTYTNFYFEIGWSTNLAIQDTIGVINTGAVPGVTIRFPQAY